MHKKSQKSLFIHRISHLLVASVFFLGGFSFVNAEESSSRWPVSNLRAEEREQLFGHQLLMTPLDSYKEIRLQPDSAEAREILDRYSDLRPNFLAEAFFVLPVEEGREQFVLREVRDFLQDVSEFEGIPYYSKHNGTWNPLFENMQIRELPVFDDGSEGIITSQKMRPFKPYTAVYCYDLSGDTLVYETYNRSPLYYKWMKGVDEEEMYTALLVKAYPGHLFFYGLGGAKAFDFFGLFGERLDVAFTGRIEAFFTWFHKEFVEPRYEGAPARAE